MPVLSKTVLANLGINLSDEAFTSLSEHFEETLDTRVFDEIAYELSPEQAHELASMRDAGDSEIVQWLQTNVPDFADIVSDEVDILLGEIAENSENIASNNN